MEVFDLQSQKFVKANGYQDYNRLIDAEYGTAIAAHREGDTIFTYWVDEEALCHDNPEMNWAVSAHVGYPVFGKAIVTAYSAELGEDVCLSNHRDLVLELFGDIII